uniref:non-specific protein-tyrosine kinase n=1 Tax=Meloidogyne javanica TaxID=6303 RepID=A0A915MM13_MELJA
MSETALIDEALNEVFVETDLIGFQSLFVFDKQLTRLEHFYDVTDEELKSYGLSEPAIRRLRQAIVKKSKKQSKTLFGGGGKKNVKLIQVNNKREKTANSCNKTLNEGGFEFNNTQPFLIFENEV